MQCIIRFEITIQPSAFVTKFIADINGEIYNGKIIKQKEEIKECNDEKDLKKENGTLIFPPYKDINNLFAIKTDNMMHDRNGSNGINGGIDTNTRNICGDKSGNMHMCGNKCNQAFDTVVINLNKLRNGYDRFALIFFNENIQKSRRYFQNNKPIGNTNINHAIIKRINLIKMTLNVIMENVKRMELIKNKNNVFIIQKVYVKDIEKNYIKC
eukprot:97243_1